MSKSIIKKIIVGLIIILSTCTITACGGQSQASMGYVNTDLPGVISDRFEQNLDIIRQLNEAGFVSDTTLADYEARVADVLSHYASNRLTLDAQGVNGDANILAAVTVLRVYGWEGLDSNKYTDTIDLVDDDGNVTSSSAITYSKSERSTADENIWGAGATNFLCFTNALVYGVGGSIDDKKGTVATAVIENTSTINTDVLAKLSMHLKHLQNKDTGNHLCSNVYKPGSGDYGGVDSNTTYINFTLEPEDENLLQPYVIVEESLANEIAEKMNYQIYVLKPDVITADGASSLDGLINCCSAAFNEYETASTTTSPASASASINRKLNNYFEPLKDASGNTVKVLDLTGMDGAHLVDYDEYSLIQNSRLQPNFDSPIQKPGYDLVVTQSIINKPLMSIRFHEFNYEAWLRIKSLLGITEGKKFYFVPNSNGDSRCYILEYPVYALNTIKESETNSNKVEGSFAESGLGINLYTGRIVKYDIEPQSLTRSIDIVGLSYLDTGTSTDSETIDEYYTTKGAANSNQIGVSSFILHGSVSKEYTLQKKINENRNDPIGSYTYTKSISAEIPRIVLRDYLEATYAPGFNEDNLVVFGRKIRLLFPEWKDDEDGRNNIAVFDKSMPIGYFIDKDGIIVANSSRLYITDFCDWRFLQQYGNGTDLTINGETHNSNDDEIICIRGVGQECQTIPGTPDEEMPANKTIEDLPLTTVSTDKIYISTVWPCRQVNSNDLSTDNIAKQRFWIIATKKGLFNSGLYSGWINSTSSTASMDWWNSYLEDNQFKYRLDHQDVNDFLLGNYKYQLGQSGVVILDLDTIAFIQEEMTEESEQERAELIRTIFIILGWIFICYSILLVPAWILDTNSDIGMDFLTKMTFGNWVAIKYREDIPNNDQSDTKYIGTTELVISVMILMLIGILLININIFDLVILLIKTIGKIAQHIEKMIKGMGV